MRLPFAGPTQSTGPLVLGALAATICSLTAVPSALAQEPVRLFERADASGASLAAKRYAAKVKRSGNEILGFVRVNAGALRAVARSRQKLVAFNLEEAADIKLAMPGGADLRAQLFLEPRPALPGHRTWTGRVRGVEESTVLFTYSGGTIAGSIEMPGLSLKIRRAEGGLYSIEKVNQRRYPNEAHPQKRSDASHRSQGKRSGEDARDPVKICASDPSTKSLSVLILHTDAAVKAAGSAADFALAVGDIVGTANAVLKTSKVRARIEVAAIVRVAVARDADSGKYLANLAGDKTVADLRRRHKANMVSLFDSFPDHYEYCGVGYLMSNSRNPPKEDGFSIVDFFCAWDAYSFIHEIGHNLGAEHNAEDAEEPLFPYAQGLRWPGRFRTVLAYGCEDSAPCSRILRFTNPNLKFSGVTLGDPTSADNTRTLNETRCFVARW